MNWNNIGKVGQVGFIVAAAIAIFSLVSFVLSRHMRSHRKHVDIEELPNEEIDIFN